MSDDRTVDAGINLDEQSFLVVGGFDENGQGSRLKVRADGSVVLSQDDVDRIAHAVVARLIRAQQIGK
jgi:hypothetical protein